MARARSNRFFERHCGSEACSNSDLERSSGSRVSFIEFLDVFERQQEPKALSLQCLSKSRTELDYIYMYMYIYRYIRLASLVSPLQVRRLPATAVYLSRGTMFFLSLTLLFFPFRVDSVIFFPRRSVR